MLSSNEKSLDRKLSFSFFSQPTIVGVIMRYVFSYISVDDMLTIFYLISCQYLILTLICPYIISVTATSPCSPSPCGPNSQCQQSNGQAVCSCVPGYKGSPPTCRPECVVSLECPLNQACNNQKCLNPCVGACGAGAVCDVINHNPICTCPPSFTGDPFVRCSVIGNYIIYERNSFTLGIIWLITLLVSFGYFQLR